MRTIVLVSGGFDPIHIGHIKYLQGASYHGDVVVLLNSDEFLMQKKGFVFMPYAERREILMACKYVYGVEPVIDKDMSVCETIRAVAKNNAGPIIFAKGGDRYPHNIPEFNVCRELHIDMIFEVGGEKIQSSSELAKRMTERGNP